jgi:hypothetical protein
MSFGLDNLLICWTGRLRGSASFDPSILSAPQKLPPFGCQRETNADDDKRKRRTQASRCDAINAGSDYERHFEHDPLSSPSAFYDGTTPAKSTLHLSLVSDWLDRSAKTKPAPTQHGDRLSGAARRLADAADGFIRAARVHHRWKFTVRHV